MLGTKIFISYRIVVQLGRITILGNDVRYISYVFLGVLLHFSLLLHGLAMYSTLEFNEDSQSTIK